MEEHMFEEDDWGDAQKTRNETKSGGSWVRLKDGEKALLVFPKAPFDYRQVWLGDHSEIFDAEKHDGKRPQGRFAFPVFEPVPGKREYSAKIFDVSGETFDAIKTVREKYGPRTLFEVRRSGSGTDTKYSVMFERELKDQEVEYLKGLEPLDAKALTLGGGSDSEDVPVDMPEGSDPWAA